MFHLFMIFMHLPLHHLPVTHPACIIGRPGPGCVDMGGPVRGLS